METTTPVPTDAPASPAPVPPWETELPDSSPVGAPVPTEAPERVTDSDGAPAEAHLEQTADRPCPECGAPIPADDVFCTACGFSFQAREAEDREVLRLQRELDAIGKDTTKASRFILILSVLFAIFGTILGFMNKSEADKARSAMAHMSPDRTLPIQGKRYTVRELRKKLKQETLFIFITNYFLAVVMAGLWLWSRKTLFPAIVTAFAIYLAVQVVNAILQPASIYQGLVFKIIFIALFISGIKTALKVRELRRAMAGD